MVTLVLGNLVFIQPREDADGFIICGQLLTTSIGDIMIGVN